MAAKGIRDCFVAPPGWVCVARDLSQAELRLLAHYSQDPKLLQVYRTTGADIHAQTMAGVGCQRPEAKITNFSCCYRIGARSLAVKLCHFTGRRWWARDAERLIEGFHATYPRVREYHDKAIAVARERGYARTLGGFRMPLPAEEWARRRHYTENRAINYPIQGGVATILKRALVQLYREWDAAGVLGAPESFLQDPRARVVIQAQTYDEVMCLARADFAEQAEADMTRVMAGAAPELSCPLATDGGIGKSWADAKK